jgi:hypothetical protein
MNSIHVLLRESIDYAGLFPPASLDMQTAVENCLQYRTGPDAWALGRFILPASRLAEFESVLLQSDRAGTSQPWALSILAGPDVAGDLERIAGFAHESSVGGARRTVTAIEVKADSPDTIAGVMRRIPPGTEVYFELPNDQAPADLVAAAGRLGGAAKIRTGGVTVDAFPSSAVVSRFIHTCVGAGVPFKATAGLHHAVRCEYPLTYEEGSGKTVMFGFLNLFMATAAAVSGLSEPTTRQILEESSRTVFRVDDSSIWWREVRLDEPALRLSRKSLVSFGSCSFTEPITELQALGWLKPQMRRA